MPMLEGKMKKTALPSAISSDGIKLSTLRQFADDWLLDCDGRRLSRNTIYNRRIILDKLFWFLEDRKVADCGKRELQHFLQYLRNGHAESAGRWANKLLTRETRPSTSDTYFRILRTFFRYLIQQDYISASPMESIGRPVFRPDQVQPFTVERISALQNAAKSSRHPLRDLALISFMYDTGVRATEVCSISLKDVDIHGRSCTLLGKGNKHRMVHLDRLMKAVGLSAL